MNPTANPNKPKLWKQSSSFRLFWLSLSSWQFSNLLKSIKKYDNFFFQFHLVSYSIKQIKKTFYEHFVKCHFSPFCYHEGVTLLLLLRNHEVANQFSWPNSAPESEFHPWIQLKSNSQQRPAGLKYFKYFWNIPWVYVELKSLNNAIFQ